MLRVNLREELDIIKDASSAKAALLSNDEFTGALLAQIGVDTQLLKKQRLARRQQLIQESYTEEQVKELCVKYRLRCLDVSLFRGKIDEAVPQKKQAFEVDYKEAMNREAVDADYRIIAPGEMFVLKDIQLDPLFVYRFRADGIWYYKLVHQWGGDLSKWRMITNYPLRTVKHLIVCALLFWLPVVVALIASMGEDIVAASMQTIFLTTTLTFFTVSLARNRNGRLQTSDWAWNSDEE